MQLPLPFGGHPEGPGSEEAHRTAEHRATGSRTATRLRRYLARPRSRLQAAGLIALGLVLLLAIVFPARGVRIAVDGDVTSVTSHATSGEALAHQAGIELRPGDRVDQTGSRTFAVRRATQAIIEVDGRVLSLRTQAETIDQVLTQADVPLDPADSVLRNDSFVSPDAPVLPPPSLASLIADRIDARSGQSDQPVMLEVRRAVPFTVAENGQELQLHSSRETVATALRDVGVRLGPGDDVQPALDTELTAGLQVHVDHATQIVVTLPEGKAILYTLAGTVGDALKQGDVALPADYRLDPVAGTPVTAGMAIHVIAVSQELELETERIQSQTVYKPDPSLPYGERRVVSGQDGVHHRQYNTVYENGQAVSRDLINDWYDPQPADTVIYYSTAEAPPGGLPDGLNPVRVLRVYATWYNPASAGRSPSDPSYGITATGVPVDRGIVAVDPSVIPLGTRLYVPGYGYAVAADTGGGIRGAMIDLGYPDGVVPDWYTHWVDIYILGP